MKQLLLWAQYIYFEETHTTHTMPQRHVHVMGWLFQNNQQWCLHMKSIALGHQWKMYISTFFYKCTSTPSQECNMVLPKGVIEGGFQKYLVIHSHVLQMKLLHEKHTMTNSHIWIVQISMEIQMHKHRQRHYVPEQAGGRQNVSHGHDESV